ncbi:hypothetical protein [Niabella beijingensis]|uniref:hypothetical protein n=1 Tax=Niabella beijingensis TaxID=2872700 RepID=UPI001CBE8717|nr:hypothetical protein [Niabella beijingensis]MBZ4192653.1 hypothetical protein [Niabella beijingensis]
MNARSSFHSKGYGAVELGASFASIQALVTPFEKTEFKDSFVAMPSSSEWFVYNEPVKQFGKSFFSNGHMFVLVKNDIIKKISLSFNQNCSALEKSLTSEFGEPAFVGSSSLNNKHKMWGIEKEILISLFCQDTGTVSNQQVEVVFSYVADSLNLKGYGIRQRFNK